MAGFRFSDGAGIPNRFDFTGTDTISVTHGLGYVPNDLLSRASDPTFYSQNRDAIRDAYYSQKGITPSPYKF